MSVVPTHVCDPHHRDLHSSSNVYPTSYFILSVLFLQVVGHLWSLHVSGIPHHTVLHPGRKVFLTTWFILSVLFFDRRWDVCVPYTCLGSPITLTSTLLGMSTWQAGTFCLCVFWKAVWRLQSLHVSLIHCHMDLHPSKNLYLTNWVILSVCVFDRWWDVSGPYMCLGSPITKISTPVETLTPKAGSFCLCCFWQAMGRCGP